MLLQNPFPDSIERDKDCFDLVTGTGKGANSGGSLFDPDDRNGGGTIYLEPAMFPRQTGDVMGTAEIALVHEIGHTLRQFFPSYFEKINAVFSGRDFTLAIRGEGYAVNFENRYRRSINADIRYSYDPTLLNVIVDFDVNLFPGE